MPSMKNADAVFLGSNNGPGYSLRELIVLHLSWRLARQNLWAHIVRGSQAPDHSPWHWQSEQPFSVVRRAVVGHLFGRSWCNGDPVDQPLPMKEIIEKTTEAATKEYVQLLRTVAEQEDKPWTVVRRHPQDTEYFIADRDDLVDYYKCTNRRQVRQERLNNLRRESLDLGKHFAVKRFSHVECHWCVDEETACGECQTSLAAKRQQKPDFSVKNMLSAIEYNGHRVPCPEYLDGQMPAAVQPLHPPGSKGKAAEDALIGDPAIRALTMRPLHLHPENDTVPKSASGPCKSLLQMLEERRLQKEIQMPIGYKSKEKILHCPVPSCPYFSQSWAELKRHRLFHHDFEDDEAAKLDIPVSRTEPPEPEPYSLAGCEPIVRAKRRRGHGAADPSTLGEQEAVDAMADSDPALAPSADGAWEESDASSDISDFGLQFAREMQRTNAVDARPDASRGEWFNDNTSIAALPTLCPTTASSSSAASCGTSIAEPSQKRLRRPAEVAAPGVRKVTVNSLEFCELFANGVFVGHSRVCGQCGYVRNLSWAPSGQMSQEHALERLLRWEQACPGTKEDHTRVGKPLLKDFDTE